jgi:putative acetyltransferase
MTGVALPTSRPETPTDTAAIRVVLRGAFARDAEADLVERLRAAEDLVLALIAESEAEGVLGYVAFVRLALQAGDLSDHAAGLAPLAVMPDRQRCGIGSALVRQGLAALIKRDERLVFVLGDPAYYTRFGFRFETAASFHARYAGTHFLGLRLAGGGPETGHIRYPAAFDQLG